MKLQETTEDKPKARRTMQADLVYSTLRELACHPTADEVYDSIHKTHPSVSRATVYRVLNKLSASGAITKVDVSQGASHFDHATHPHQHVRCIRCGRVDDVKGTFDDDLDAKVSESSGYVITGHSLHFNGVCPGCQEEGREAKAKVS